MGIFANNIVCACHNSAIHKFIIVRVLLYKMKTETRCKKPCKRASNNCIDDIMSHSRIGYALYDFLIFIHNIISHAKFVFSFSKSLPCCTIRAMYRQHLHQTIGIQYH